MTKQKGVRKSGYKILKICGGKMYSRTRTFGAEVHKKSHNMAQQVQNIN